MKPGVCHPLIARPSDAFYVLGPEQYPNITKYHNELSLIRERLTILTRYMERLFQTVHPSPNNYDTYGNEIRNLLILACTEAEASWRGVLRANGYQSDRYSTNDYVKLAKPMRLAEYAVSFPRYPWISPIKPFENWGKTGKPTQEIEWYDVYNAVKHDSILNFSQAKLKYSMQAISALAIMLCAQFGRDGGFQSSPDLNHFFHFTDVPKWNEFECYRGTLSVSMAGSWIEENYQFD